MSYTPTFFRALITISSSYSAYRTEHAKVQKLAVGDIVIINSDNYKLIKHALNKNYIHLVEKLNSMYQNSEWRKLFEFAVDNNDDGIFEN